MARVLSGRSYEGGILKDVTNERPSITSQRFTDELDSHHPQRSLKDYNYLPSQEQKLMRILGSPFKPRAAINSISVFDLDHRSLIKNEKHTPKAEPTGKHKVAAEEFGGFIDDGIFERYERFHKLEEVNIYAEDLDFATRAQLRKTVTIQNQSMRASHVQRSPHGLPPITRGSDRSSAMPNSPQIGYNGFPIASSLMDDDYSQVEIEVPTSIDRHQLPTSHNNNNRGRTQSGDFTHAVHKSKHRRVSSTGQIDAPNTGSQMRRTKSSISHTARGREALSSRGLARLEAVRRSAETTASRTNQLDSLANDSTLIDPFVETPMPKSRYAKEEVHIDGDLNDEASEEFHEEMQDSANRRSTRYGTGPKIRFALDADEFIMGKGYAEVKKTLFQKKSLESILQKPRKLKTQIGSHPSYPGNLHTGYTSQKQSSLAAHLLRQECGQVAETTSVKSIPTRKSSLPSSPEYISFQNASSSKTSQVSVTDRLSRPTKSSQARAASRIILTTPSKATLSSSTSSTTKSSFVLKKVSIGSLSVPTITSVGTVPGKKGFKRRFSAILNSRPSETKPRSAGCITKETSSEIVEPVASFNNITNPKGILASTAKFDDGSVEKLQKVDYDAGPYPYHTTKSHDMMAACTTLHEHLNNPMGENLIEMRSGRDHNQQDENPPAPHNRRDTEGKEAQRIETESDIVAFLKESRAQFDYLLTLAQGVTNPATRELLGSVLTPMVGAIEATRAAYEHKLELDLAINALIVHVGDLGILAGQVVSGNIPPDANFPASLPTTAKSVVGR